MNIKVKLRLAIGLLFFMILLLSLIAASYIYSLKEDTEKILADNYDTIEYSRNMLTSMDNMQSNPSAWILFESNLSKQKKNVTEIGEAEATQRVADHFDQLKLESSNLDLKPSIRNDISTLISINMQAIQAKSDSALLTVKSAVFWIVITGTICFVIALTLLINLPGNIANPVKELSASIREIADKNYAQRVHFDRKDEFGQLSESFNSMAEKLEEYNNSNLSRILIEKKRIEALINNMHEPVIGLDENKIVLFANQEALKIIGLSMSEMIGRSAVDLSVHNDLIRTLIQQPTTPNEHQPESSLKIYADNKESYFEKEMIDITITPTGERQKVYIGQVIVLKNITPFKELDFAKTNFIATVSHELKTPISSIKMSLLLLENQKIGHINAEQLQLIESIKEDSDRLLKITGELLNMSQVETGNIQLNIQQSRPEQILYYALEAVKVQAEQKQIGLIVEMGENLSDVKADTEKTAWVLINFLTNAIRYSQQQGQIHIEIKEDEEGIRFAVKDEGKGIDSRYRAKIFNRYFQVPGSAKSGIGLGLAISKEFIEAQGGHIGVNSEIGMGSTFFFQLAMT
jgi:NtrC-family two-component system sensor histidine kinase KinB